MSFFKRWYVQSYITKIDPTLAKQFLGEIKPGFSQLTENEKQTLVRKTAKIDAYHCNIKVPVYDIKELWNIEEGQPIDGNSYSDAYGNNSTFLQFLAEDVFKNFVEHERDKIEKVGQYLIGDPTLELPALERPLQTYTSTGGAFSSQGGTSVNGEGVKLFDAIVQNSDIIFTGKYYIDTGPEGLGALMFFQALLFIPGELEGRANVMTGPIPSSDGVVPLSLNEIREVACKPTPKEEKKTKPDDPNAEKNIEKGKKTQADINRKKLTKKQKQEIAISVRKRINQVGDAAFINALIRAKDIKTTQQVFDFVLNVMPVGQLIEIAIDCAKKFIDAPPDNVVCDIIMRNLTSDDVQQILIYTNTNLSASSVAQSFKNQVINSFNGSVEDDPAGFKSFLINQFNNNVSTKTIICAMVFAALPAAITLLALYTKQSLSNVSPDGTCGDPLLPSEKELKTVLENPVKTVLSAIENGLKSHPILSYTKNLPDKLLDQMLVFVDQLLVQSIALMLQEIAYLCEGSSKSDYANALPSAEIYNQDINDYVSNQAIYDGLLDFLDDALLQDDAEDDLLTKELVRSFFTDLGSFLTLSEICVLFGGASAPGDVNYDLIIEKIFYGLLSLEVYKPLKKVLNTKEKLINFLDIFADDFDQALCAEKIEDLTKAKKVLSKLCESSDEAYVNDLRQKAASDAINNLLDQEEDLLNDLFDAIKNIIDPEQPVVFCGPEAEKKGVEPLLPSFQDPSQTYLAKKHISALLSGSSKIFESEVGNFKNALTANPIVGELTNMPAAAQQVFSLGTAMASAMGRTYDISLNNDDGQNTLPPEPVGGVTEYFKNLTNNNKLVAPKVNDVLTGNGKGNLITNVTQVVANSDEQLNVPGEVVGALYEISTKGKEVQYFANYSSETHTIDGVDEAFADLGPFTARLLFSIGTAEIEAYDRILPEEAVTGAQQLTGYTNALALTNIFSADSESSANTERSSAFKDLIKDLVYSPDFFADILERVIVEHSEFVTSLDLFQKSSFNKLSFVKINPCDKSLFDFNDILEKFEDRAKYIECKIGFGKIPTPSEITHIASLYESLLRVVVLNEAMKSFFVFASFGFDNLVKFSQEGQDKETFYLQYLSAVVEDKMDSIIPADFQAIVEQIVSLAAAADTKNDEINFSDSINYFVGQSFKQSQSVLKSKLEKAGYTSHIFGGEFGFEFIEAEVDSQAVTDATILKNLIPAEKNLAVLNPPKIVDIDFGKKEIIVPTGTFTANPRLKNGGFFIERGFEVFHNRKERATTFGLNSDKLELIISMLRPFTPVPGVGNNLPFSQFGLTKGPNGFTTGFGKPPDYKNIFNIVGYPLNLGGSELTNISSAPIFSTVAEAQGDPIARLFNAIQTQLLGGEPVTGGVISTIFSDDYPLQRALSFAANEPRKQALINFSERRQGRLPIDGTLKANYGYGKVFEAKNRFAEELRTGIEFSYQTVGANNEDTITKLIGLLEEGEVFDLDSLLQKLENRFKLMETYFYKFGEYKTINLLIKLPFDQSQEATADDASFYKNAFFTKNTFESLIPMEEDSAEGEKNRSAFYQAVLEKKYFIREEAGDLYFKLPIAYQYTPVGNYENLIELETNSEISFDSIIESFSYNGEISGTLETLFSSLSYVDLLSFVSVLVTKTLSEEYPNLNSIFQNTELALKTGIEQALSTSNREENSNLYENNFNAGQFNSPNQANMDLLSLFMEGLVKGVANMTDPTWRTPWFLPGPLTPFGILAKFLEGAADEPTAKSSADKNKESVDDPNAFECNDDT